MTIKEVQQRLARIEEHKDTDPEGAHAERDDLYRDVLIYATDPSSGCPWDLEDCPEISDVATEALKAEQIKLRWEACA